MRHRPAFRSSFVPAILVFMLLVLSVIIVRFESDETQDTRTGAQACLQVQTMAKNVKTGECRLFSTACLPTDWVKAACEPGEPFTPVAPKLLTNTGNANSITLTWQDIAQNETDYALYKSGVFTGVTVAANSTTLTTFAYGCTINNGQQFSIAARNAQGATVSNSLPLTCSAPSGVTCPAPAAPTWAEPNAVVRTSVNSTSDKIVLKWTAVAGASGYYVDYSTNNGQSWYIGGVFLAGTLTNSASPINVGKNETVIVRVRTQTSCGSNSVFIQRTVSPLVASTDVNCDQYTKDWAITSVTPTYTAGKVALSIKGRFPQIAQCGRRSMDGNGFSLVYSYKGTSGNEDKSYYAYRPEHVVSISETEVKLQPAYTFSNGNDHELWLIYCKGVMSTANPGACTSAKGYWSSVTAKFSITNPVGGGATVTPLPQCLAVVIRIRNKTTGECKLHNNSCVPDGWEKADNCVLGTPTPSPRPALPAVTNLKYSCNAKGDKVTFTWDSVSGAANYQVRLDYHPDSWAPPYPTPTPNTNRDVNDQMPGLMSSRSWTPTILPNEEYWMTVQAVRSTDIYPYTGLYASTGRFTCRPKPTSSPTPPRATNTPRPTSSPTPPRATVIPPRATNTPRPNATITPPPGANTPVPNTPVPGNTNFNLALYLHGIGRGGTNVQPNSTGTMDPLTKSRVVTIDIFDANNQPLTSRTGKVDYDSAAGNFKGAVDMGSLQPGSYTVKVRTPYYLRRAYPGIVQVGSNGTASLRPLAFVGADTDNSNSINVLDYNRILDCFTGFEEPSPDVCDPTKKVDTDITDDGITNEKDLNLFLVELAVQRGDDDIPLPSGVPTQ